MFPIDAIMSSNGGESDDINSGLIIGLAAALVIVIISMIIVVVILYWRFRKSMYINVQYNIHAYYILIAIIYIDEHG